MREKKDFTYTIISSVLYGEASPTEEPQDGSITAPCSKGSFKWFQMIVHIPFVLCHVGINDPPNGYSLFGTMALMDAGIQIKKPVSGIAMIDMMR